MKLSQHKQTASDLIVSSMSKNSQLILTTANTENESKWYSLYNLTLS